MKIPKPFFLIAAVLLIIAPLFNIWLANPAYATANTGFKAGYIMSNDVMANYNSMSLAQIQSFLKSKNPCNDTNTYRASYYPWVTYRVKDGHFVCMADDTFNGKSAARIIYDAGQTYKINPQVLIVLLQKEQGLITDTWPNSQQYRSATGYGCPDTAACDARYYGFENQVMRAAELFRTVLDGGWSNYPAGKYSYIRYNPNAACGGSNVYIRNRATAALYRYTPYQPNQATLNAGWGTAPCGAYGNRNFYLYYTAWFGNPVATGNEVQSNANNARDFGTATTSTTTQATQTTTSTTPKATTQTTVQIPASTIYLPTGVYNLRTDSGLSLTVSGSKATLQPFKNTMSQQFKITRLSNGFYTINSRSPVRYLSASTSTTQGAQLQLKTSANSCAEKWSLALENSHYTFRSTCTAYALGFAADSSGAATGTYRHKTAVITQAWNLTAKDQSPFIEQGGTFSLVNARGLALTVQDGATAFGANLQLNYKDDSPAQEFIIKRQSDGFFTITNPRANKAVAIASTGSNVHLVQISSNSCNQRWFVELYAGHYLFRSACHGNALGATSAQVATNGANVQAASVTRADSQLWSVTKNNLGYLTQDTYRITTGSLKSLDFNPNALSGQTYLIKNSKNWSQEVQFVRTSEGYFNLINPRTGRALAVANTAFGASVEYAQLENTCRHKWFITTFYGYYAIHSACSRAVLDINGFSIGSTAYAGEFMRKLSQQWKITKF